MLPLLLSAALWAQLTDQSGPKAAAPALSTKVYEREDTQEIKAKVKSIREVRGDLEVTFESDKFRSYYTVEQGPSYKGFKEALERSKAPGGPQVTVTIDNSDVIKSVSTNSNAPAAKAKVFVGE